jgi:hypothetical protein
MARGAVAELGGQRLDPVKAAAQQRQVVAVTGQGAGYRCTNA